MLGGVLQVAVALFDGKAESGDDDETIARYHFPRRDLKAAGVMPGGWGSDIAELGFSVVAIALLSFATLILVAASPAATTAPLPRA